MDPRFFGPDRRFFAPDFGPRLVERQDTWPDPLAWAMFALLLVLLAGTAFLVASRFGGGTRWRRVVPAGPPVDDPLAVLRLRYARGELSREEFLQASEDLGGAAAPPLA